MNAELRQNLIQRVAVGDIFRRRASTSGSHTAIVEQRGETLISLSYEEFNSQLSRFVRAARKAGLKKGDRIGLLGGNSVEYLIAQYGCAKGGFVAVPVNPGLNPKQITYILNHAETKALLADDILCDTVFEIMPDIPDVKHFTVFSLSGKEVREPFVDFAAFIGSQSDDEIEDVIINDRDTCEILYTSGTTSDPKGVMISHLSIFIMSLTNAIELDFPRKVNMLNLMPNFHCAQQTFCISTLHLGGKVAVLRGFEPGEVLKTIEREKLEVLFCLPAMYRAMLDHPYIREADLSSVKTCMYAMTPMDRRTLEEAIEVFSADFLLVTGQTESFPSTNTFRSEWQLKKQGNYWGESALTLDTAVMDTDGAILPANKIGEIVWRGPNTMNEYLKNPEATVASQQFGWHHSGDLGYFDDDGLLIFVDRIKDMIKTGGENVPSIKVERAILGDPRVEMVAVIGLPHERWIEAVTAFVIRKEGAELDEEDVINLCRKELGGFEIPKRIVFVEELPKTTTGKLEKYKIRNQYNTLYSR